MDKNGVQLAINDPVLVDFSFGRGKKRSGKVVQVFDDNVVVLLESGHFATLASIRVEKVNAV